jgi:hypothetical protein
MVESTFANATVDKVVEWLYGCMVLWLSLDLWSSSWYPLCLRSDPCGLENLTTTVTKPLRGIHQEHNDGSRAWPLISIVSNISHINATLRQANNDQIFLILKFVLRSFSLDLFLNENI